MTSLKSIGILHLTQVDDLPGCDNLLVAMKDATSLNICMRRVTFGVLALRKACEHRFVIAYVHDIIEKPSETNIVPATFLKLLLLAVPEGLSCGRRLIGNAPFWCLKFRIKLKQSTQKCGRGVHHARGARYRGGGPPWS